MPWEALFTAAASLIVAVLTFVSRGRTKKENGRLGREVIENEELIEALVEEIAALRLGDHGLDHTDMGGVLFGNLRDDTRDDA